MFRYLGLAWNVDRPMSAARAQHLAAAVRTRSEWVAALVCPGLQVFATGTRPGINGIYRLHDSRGVVLGKLFRRSDLDPSRAGGATLMADDTERILTGGGQALVTDFWGRYVAFLPTASGSTGVIRDPSGTLPCFFIRIEGVSILFSWLEDALALVSDIDLPRVNWDALKAHVRLDTLGGRATALEGVLQILPGEALDLETGISTTLWSAVDIARTPATHSPDEAARLLRDAVRACTRSWASCYRTLLMRLSGGLDSSILLSCLDPAGTPADVICVNYHSPGSDSDERHYARLAAVRSGRDLIERERIPDFRIDSVLKIARMPSPVAYIGWMNARTDARLASGHGAAAMFTGAGGDALFFEVPRWWPAADYLRLNGLNLGFATAAIDAARLGRLSIWKTFVLAASEHLRPRLAARSLEGPESVLVSPGFAELNLHGERFVHPDLLNVATLPIGKWTQTAALMYPIGYYDPFEQDAAPELVNPLLSQPLVEFCLSTPTYVLTQGGRGRALARRAFSSDLPPQIATRRSKGGMEEHIKAVLLANLDFARTMLLDGKLVRRGLLDRAKVEEALSGRPTALAGQLGQIHALIGVEAWLTRWSR